MDSVTEIKKVMTSKSHKNNGILYTHPQNTCAMLHLSNSAFLELSSSQLHRHIMVECGHFLQDSIQSNK
jgi:hypothetical protein